MQLLTNGQSKSFDYGPAKHRITYRVVVTRDTLSNGISIDTFVGADRSPILSRTFTEPQLAEGRIFQAYLRDSANAGQPVWQIEAGVSAILSAAAVVDDAEQQMLDGIRANLAGPHADLDAVTEQARRDADEVAARQAKTGGWYAFRAQAAARNVQPRPTLAGAHLAPPTPVQVAAARQHRNGVVYPGNGIGKATLKALARKQYGTVRYNGARKEIVALDLNGRGMALAQQNGVAA